MTTATIIKFLDQLFTLCDTASFVRSDNAGSFSSLEFKVHPEQRGISSNQCSICHHSENGQTEKTVQTVWKTIQPALKTVKLPREQWKIVLPEALHSIRLLPCTATNATSNERYFSFQRRSSIGHHFQVGFHVHELRLFSVDLFGPTKQTLY